MKIKKMKNSKTTKKKWELKMKKKEPLQCWIVNIIAVWFLRDESSYVFSIAVEDCWSIRSEIEEEIIIGIGKKPYVL